MLNIDFDDEAIGKLASVICGDDYHEKFCENESLTKCPVYRTTEQLEKFFDGIVENKLEKGQSRRVFVINCLNEVNNFNKMDIVLEKLTNPKIYRDEEIIQFILNKVNGIIMWDGIEIKLKNNKPNIVVVNESISIGWDDLELKDLIDNINDSIASGKPIFALDRLHTLMHKYIKELCLKHGINFKDDDRLDVLFKKYVNYIKDYLDSPMTLTILKSNISLFSQFNDVRNNYTYAHDNNVLGDIESKLIFKNLFNVKNFIDELEEVIWS